MDYEKIKQLMNDMENSKLTLLDIEFPDGMKIKMEKKNENNLAVNPECKRIEYVTTNDIVSKSSNFDNINNSKSESNIENEKTEGNIVKSPMVGTFYIKPSPDSNPYVEIGSEVKKGNVLCIIEAMKLMNEIESEYEGKIVEIFAKDGEIVDYGKPLFRIV